MIWRIAKKEFLLNLIIVYSSGVIELNADDWLKMSVIVLLSILYLSIFVLLGMMCVRLG